MQVASLLLMAALAAALPGQAPRLVDGVEAPLAYLCLEAMPPAAAATGGAAAKREAGPVQRLLADPSLDALFRSPATSPSSTATATALALVRGVLARSSGELELVLTGILPQAGQPLLVLRARLQSDEAERLQTLLASGELAAPDRRIGERQTYRLRGAEGAAAGPGEHVELALVGNDLLVGNDGSSLAELLTPVPAVTSATPQRAVLSADPRFRALRRELPAPAGSLWIYTDWQRLGTRVPADLDGLAGALLGSSGLGGARTVLASVSSAQSGFSATVLLEFDAARKAGRFDNDCGIDGWLAAVRPVPARQLLAELPGGGIGGLVLSVDLAAVAGSSRDGVHLLHDIEGAFEHYGLDFRRNVLDRLGERGTVQLQVGQSGQAAGGMASIYSLRAKSRKAAADLFADLRRVGEAEGFAQLLPGKDSKDRRGIDVLQLRSRHGGPGGEASVAVAVVDDAVMLAPDAAELVAFVDELRRSPKARGKRDQAVVSAVQSIGGENVAGLFDVDLQPWFEQLAGLFAGAGAQLDLSQLPKRHIGYLELQRDGGAAAAGAESTGSVVRVRVLSSR